VTGQLSVESPRLLRHAGQRLEILEAAAAAIAEHGFHGMTMRGLAKATGRGLATFYNYFSSKEDVLFSLQSEAFETMADTANLALKGIEEPVDRLYVFVLNHLRYSAEHRSVMRVLVHEASALPAGRRKTVRLLKEGYFKICRDIVASILAATDTARRAMAAPDPAEVERVTYSMFGMLNWSYGWYDPGQHGSPEDVAKTIHALAVCGLGCPHRFAPGDPGRHPCAIAAPLQVTALGCAAAAPKTRLSGTGKHIGRADARKTYGQETV